MNQNFEKSRTKWVLITLPLDLVSPPKRALFQTRGFPAREVFSSETAEIPSLTWVTSTL